MLNEISSFVALKLDLLVLATRSNTDFWHFVGNMYSGDAFVYTCLAAARVCVDDQNKPGARERFFCLLYFENCFFSEQARGCFEKCTENKNPKTVFEP